MRFGIVGGEGNGVGEASGSGQRDSSQPRQLPQLLVLVLVLLPLLLIPDTAATLPVMTGFTCMMGLIEMWLVMIGGGGGGGGGGGAHADPVRTSQSNAGGRLHEAISVTYTRA